MTGKQFKLIRKTSLKYSQAELATAMESHKSIIRDIEAKGDEEIRGVYKVCIELLVWKGRLDMQQIKENIERDLDQQFPNGIPSAGVRA
ncbi:MAG: hypothetical protein HXX17_16540 [Geobacteraceae bacterium]|nr:hypothetical protein [Geobacteraceae bacterium]